MSPIEAQAARRRAELLWQQKTREVAAAEAAVKASSQAEAQGQRHAADAKTARLRMLRLARDDQQRKAAAAKPKPKRRVGSAPKAKDAIIDDPTGALRK